MEYIRFVLDTCSVRELEARPIREMEIAYVSQSYEGDVLTVHRDSLDKKDIFMLQKKGEMTVRGEIVFEDSAAAQAL